MSAIMRVYKGEDTPLYIQAADALRARIADGLFRPGDKLPSVRKLSDELGLNPATIVSAYRILTREGLIVSKAGSGAYVSSSLSALPPGLAPAPAPGPDGLPLVASIENSAGGPLLDLSTNAPPRDLYPLEDLKRFFVEAIDSDGGAAFDYQDPAGYPALKAALAARLSLCLAGGIEVDAEDLHIVSGAQQGLDLAARVLLRRGDVAAIEAPGYRGAFDAFIAAGVRVEAIELDEEGLDIDALGRLASTRPLRLVHVSPSCQNPTGLHYSEQRRRDIVALAERYDFYVLEDDLYGDLALPGSAPSLRSFDAKRRVLYVKSFSKTLLPGLRIAGLEAPTSLRSRIEDAKRSVDLSSNGLMQRALERFLASGRYDEHLLAARARYTEAYERFSAFLKPGRTLGLDWHDARGGINLWLYTAGISGRAFADACLRHGCLVAPEAAFRFSGSRVSDTHVRVSFGSITMSELENAAKALLAAMHDLAGTTGRPSS
jgi:2-aminoadipate transaminase